MGHPTRSLPGVIIGTGVLAGAILVGPAPLGQAAVAAPASVLFDVAASLDPPPPPDPPMPAPAIDGPANDGPAMPPSSHHRPHHYYSRDPSVR